MESLLIDGVYSVVRHKGLRGPGEPGAPCYQESHWLGDTVLLRTEFWR